MNFILFATIPEYDLEDGIAFKVEHTFPSKREAVDAIRQAVKAWTLTDNGLEAVIHSGLDFNWGDLAMYDIGYIPGILSLECIDFSTMEVSHDEHLYDESLKKQ